MGERIWWIMVWEYWPWLVALVVVVFALELVELWYYYRGDDGDG